MFIKVKILISQLMVALGTVHKLRYHNLANFGPSKYRCFHWLSFWQPTLILSFDDPRTPKIDHGYQKNKENEYNANSITSI